MSHGGKTIAILTGSAASNGRHDDERDCQTAGRADDQVGTRPVVSRQRAARRRDPDADRPLRAAPKVLLGRRHASHKFMPGKFVFPGRAHRSARSHDDGGQRTAPGHGNETDGAGGEPERGTGARLCARRGARDGGGNRPAARRQTRRCRRRCRARSGPNSPRRSCIPTSAISISSPAPSRRRAGRGVSTPVSSPPMPPRSPTRIEGVVGPDSELVELIWVPIEEATKLDMPTITGVVLEELAARVARRHGARPAGAVLFHDRAAVFPGTAVNARQTALS